MQEEKSIILDFTGRTDALAARLGCNLKELPPRLGFSLASLFAYRSGKAKISSKAWHRLALAETAAGIETPLVRATNAGGDDLNELLNMPGDEEDIDAQLAVFLGMKLFGQGVQYSWDRLERDLQSFFRKIRTSGKIDPAHLLDPDISVLRANLQTFRHELKVYFERLANLDLD